jgi:hypothetical protein
MDEINPKFTTPTRPINGPILARSDQGRRARLMDTGLVSLEHWDQNLMTWITVAVCREDFCLLWRSWVGPR